MTLGALVTYCWQDASDAPLIHHSRLSPLIADPAVVAPEQAPDGTWHLDVVSAGHPLPIHADGATAHTLGRPGRLLGVFDDAPVHLHQTRLDPGHFDVFYTDGVTDLPPPFDLGVEDFTRQIARLHRVGRAETIADQIEAALVERVSDPYRADDVALVVVRVEPD